MAGSCRPAGVLARPPKSSKASRTTRKQETSAGIQFAAVAKVLSPRCKK
jgi:hypothetical protein